MGNTGSIKCNQKSQAQDCFGSLQEKVETPAGQIFSTPNGRQKFFIKDYCFCSQEDSQKFKAKLSGQTQQGQNKSFIEQESHLMPLIKIVQIRLNNYCSISFKLKTVYQYHSYSLYDQLVSRAKAYFEQMQNSQGSSRKRNQNDFDFQTSFGSQPTKNRKSTQNKMKCSINSEKQIQMIKLFNQEEIWCIISGCIIGVCQLIRKDGYHHNQLGLKDIKISRQGIVLLLRNQMIGCEEWHQISELGQTNINRFQSAKNYDYGLQKLAKTIMSMMLADPQLMQQQNNVSKQELQQVLRNIDQSVYSFSLKTFIAKLLDPQSEFIYLEDELLKILESNEPILKQQSNASQYQFSAPQMLHKEMNRASTRRLLIHNQENLVVQSQNKTQKTSKNKSNPLEDKFASVIIFSGEPCKEKVVLNNNQNQKYTNSTNSTKNTSVRLGKRDQIETILTNQIPLTQQNMNSTIKSSNQMRRQNNKDGCLNITLKNLKARDCLQVKKVPLVSNDRKVQKQNNISSF